MGNEKHIKNISIENFKCFDFLSIQGFSKYNLILGDNNVGKTSFLESLLFDKNITQTISNFQGVLEFKSLGDQYGVNPFDMLINKYSNKFHVSILISYFKGNDVDLKFETVKNELLDNESRSLLNNFFNVNQTEKEILKITSPSKVEYRSFKYNENYETSDDFIPYLYSSAYYNADLVSFYTENFTDSKEAKNKLINDLRFFIPTLSNIELTISHPSPLPVLAIWLDDRDSLLPLPLFGDGTVRLFRVIMEISVSRDKYLCVDEIDTGVHHTKYKSFCKIILSVAKSNNVQLFLTTHNNEFLKAFKEVLEEKDFTDFQNETKCFSLKKLPDNSIKAYSYDFEEFEFAIEQENEIR